MPNLQKDIADGSRFWWLSARRNSSYLLLVRLVFLPLYKAVSLGAATHYFLKLENGCEVEAVQDSDMWEILPTGAKVWLTMKAKKINVFTPDGDIPLVVREELL